MTKTYVLVQTSDGAPPIARTLQALPGVLFAQDVLGPYDAVALTLPDRTEGGLQAILSQIRGLPGVLRALAAPVASGPDGVGEAA
ncbi:MAG TPA: Lrp/AsnC family transcriptional regulator [Actinomycetota bacterium]|nr:Lrp/AsnC family transcriptional regulator [Actinomycetota bacterium]